MNQVVQSARVVRVLEIDILGNRRDPHVGPGVPRPACRSEQGHSIEAGCLGVLWMRSIQLLHGIRVPLPAIFLFAFPEHNTSRVDISALALRQPLRLGNASKRGPPLGQVLAAPDRPVMRQSLSPISHPETRVRFVRPLEGGCRVVVLEVMHEQYTGQEMLLRLGASAVGKLDHAEPLVSG